MAHPQQLQVHSETVRRTRSGRAYRNPESLPEWSACGAERNSVTVREAEAVCAPGKFRQKRSESQPTKSQPTEQRRSAVTLGKPKSGRVWKDRNKQRFSALLRDKPLRSSWDQKMEIKREKALVKKFAQDLKEQKTQQKEEKRKRCEENLRRREENQRKAEIVQVIRNTSKIKRMKKKQLRRVEKRDTLNLQTVARS